MRSIVYYVLVMSLLTGCSTSIRPENVKEIQYSRLQENAKPDVEGLRIISANTRVSNEQYASISIIGKPGVTYSISSIYKWGRNDVEAFEKKKAGNDGIVTWIWQVRSNTAPGTYPITISGGGQKLETSYTVIS